MRRPPRPVEGLALIGGKRSTDERRCDVLGGRGCDHRARGVDQVRALEIGHHAKVRDRVLRFLASAGIRERAARNNPEKAKPGKKAEERAKAKAAAAGGEAAAS